MSRAPRPSPEEPVDPAVVDRVRARLHRLLALLLVGLLPWFVAPGLVQPDTKLDLVLSPARYLGRAAWAWNDHTGIGELQNQAYGYLWPMGPFFWAGDALGMPDWVIQRGWWMLLLVVAMAGAERLARRAAGLPTVPALVAGAVYALSPRVLTVLAEISVEVWPSALAPWLVLAARRMVAPGASAGGRRRAAVVTGLLAATLGGVNATVSLLALVPAAGWIVLAPRGRQRLRALAWWLTGAALGSLWWLGPLVVLGRWSYPFLDHIELASTTTAVASLVNVLRGAEHWIAYILTGGDHPTWQSGWVLAQTVVGIVGTTVLAGLGLAGLVRRRAAAEPDLDEDEGGARHLTRWALASVLLGVVVMAAGRDGAAGGVLAEPVRSLLDGPLAPLRNVHKADLLVRLPVALGVGLLVHWLTRVRGGAGDRLRPLGVAATVLALVGATLPVWQGRVGDAWAYEEVPTAWRTVAAELDRAADREGGTTLVLPGARTADYVWGRTADEPLVALASSPVLARAAAPLGHPGATRVLDGIDLLTSSGQAVPALPDQLGRLGVRRVVVRWGISPDVGAVEPDAVARSLDATPGLERVSEHGEGHGRIVTWRVDRAVPDVTGYPVSSAVTVAGAPEAWPWLVEAGLAPAEEATVLVGDERARPAEVVATDTLRWQALNSGRPPQRGHSPTLDADDPRPATVGTKDLAPGGLSAGRTTRETRGVSVTASSSAADPFARHWRSAGTGPDALLDGDPATAWRPGDGEAVQRLTLSFRQPTAVHEVVVRPPRDTWLTGPDQVEIAGARGHAGGDGTVRVVLDGSERRALVLTLTTSSSAEGTALAVSEIEMQGPRGRIPTGTRLVLPDGDVGLLLTRDPRAAADVTDGEDPADLVRSATLPSGSLAVRAWVRARPGTTGGVDLDCGEAGVVEAGGARVGLAARLTADDVRTGRVVPARACGGLSGADGRTEVRATAGDLVLPERVALRPVTVDGPAADPRAVSAERVHAGRWRVTTGAGTETYLTLAQGANDGWQARTADGTELTPVVVDGWRQGFVLPAGGPTAVDVAFAPNADHRRALLLGAAGVLGLLLWGLGEMTRRGRPRTEPASRRVHGGAESAPPVLVVGAAALTGLLVAGPAGTLAAAAGSLVPARWRAAAVALLLAVAGLSLAVLGVAERQSAGAWVAQVLGALTVGLLVAALLRPGRGAPRR